MKSNVILVGPIGSGKNWCLRTLLAEWPDINGRIHKGAGKQVMNVQHEPGWEATNGDLTCDMGFHVHEHLPYNAPLDQYQDWLQSIATKAAADIREMKLGAAIKQPFAQSFMGLFDVMNNYICDRCGQNFGPVSAWAMCTKCKGKGFFDVGSDLPTEECGECHGKGQVYTGWNEDRVLVEDGLTGLTTIATHFTAGPKPTLTWPEIDCAQHHIENFVMLCTSIRSSYVLISHWSRQPREVEGGTAITVDTIGAKLSPRLLKPFDEIIVCRRDVDKYTWNMVDVDNMHVDQKARRLPYKTNINPSFTEIFGNGR